jgi:hypothetical protein
MYVAEEWYRRGEGRRKRGKRCNCVGGEKDEEFIGERNEGR